MRCVFVYLSAPGFLLRYLSRWKVALHLVHNCWKVGDFNRWLIRPRFVHDVECVSLEYYLTYISNN